MTTAIRDTLGRDLRTTLRALKLGQMPGTLADRLTLARQQRRHFLTAQDQQREGRSNG